MIGPWLWAFYFAAKLALHFEGAMRVHFLPNFLLAAAALPFKPRRASRRGAREVALATALAAAAVALAWYDSYLPPFWYAATFAVENPRVLTSGFLHGFVGGLVSAGPLLALTAALAAFAYAARRGLHPTPAVLIALLFVPAQALRQPRDVAARARGFYERERARRVDFPARAAGKPFDVVLIHVCSLSWDDLDAIGAGRSRLLEGANYVFTGFNSATSYSTPAALRLLRAPCGQVEHSRLYDPWPSDCSLFDRLRAAGFRSYLAVNYEPGYFGMTGDLARYAGAAPPIPVDGLPVRLLNYDDAKVLDNGRLLARWWSRRQQDGADRAFLYFNTVSLHGGTHEDKPGWWTEPAVPLYARGVDRLASDLDELYARIAASGRSAVVVLVSEHGRALRATPAQASDLRDIPLPPITRVPVALRLIGPLFSGAPRGRTDGRPRSYLALARLLAALVSDPATASDAARMDREVASLPETPFMSETDKWKVFGDGGGYFLLGKDGEWRPLSAANARPALAAAGGNR
ncbi:MAG: cellulose biosynthesis protein BcsG [Elusimicrobia bacterium]|nr:cellulose biosynthesis protein BcsG [Elusimicrobiota bacterium]